MHHSLQETAQIFRNLCGWANQHCHSSPYGESKERIYESKETKPQEIQQQVEAGERSFDERKYPKRADEESFL